jgi:hypothetical protein
VIKIDPSEQTTQKGLLTSEPQNTHRFSPESIEELSLTWAVFRLGVAMNNIPERLAM